MDREGRNLLTHIAVMAITIVFVVLVACLAMANPRVKGPSGPAWNEGLAPEGLMVVALWIGDDGRIESEVVMRDGTDWLKPGLPPVFVENRPPFAWKEVP